MKITYFNLENFFLPQLPKNITLESLDERDWYYFSDKKFPLKSLEKTYAAAKYIKQLDSDILCLSEVGGKHSIKIFNNLFLNNKYHIVHKPTNSKRCIDICFLIKKELINSREFFFRGKSYRDEELDLINPDTDLKERFSRDLIELKIYRRKNYSNPDLILYSTHLKSRIDKDGFDPQGFKKRKAEFNKCLEIINSQHKDSPIIFGGDFNGDATRKTHEETFTKLYENNTYFELFEDNNFPTYIKNDKELKLDYIFSKHSDKEKIKNIEESKKCLEFSDHIALSCFFDI